MSKGDIAYSLTILLTLILFISITTQTGNNEMTYLTRAIGFNPDVCHPLSAYYVSNWAAKLHELNVDTLRIDPSSYGDIWGVNMYSNSTTWAVNFDSFLNTVASQGFKVILKDMGDPWGTFLGLHGSDPSGDYPALIDISGNIITELTSDAEVASGYATTDTYLARLAGSNALSKNFFADPRIVAWSPANEWYMGSAGGGATQGDKNYAWWCHVADYIRAHGGKVVCNNPLYGNAGTWNQDFADTVHHFDGTVGSRHADYMEFHYYANGDTLHSASDNGDGLSSWEDWQTELESGLQAYITNRGNFALNELFIGEFGLWVGYTASYEGGAWTFTDNDQANYVNYYFNAIDNLGFQRTSWYSFGRINQNLPYGVIQEPEGTEFGGYDPLSTRYGAGTYYTVTVEDNAGGTTDTGAVDITVPEAETVTITVEPNTGYAVDHTEVTTSTTTEIHTENPIVITPTEDTIVTPIFTPSAVDPTDDNGIVVEGGTMTKAYADTAQADYSRADVYLPVADKALNKLADTPCVESGGVKYLPMFALALAKLASTDLENVNVPWAFPYNFPFNLS